MIGLPNPWLIIGGIFLAVSVYFYGHHVGWDERNQEMQAEIASKNEASRQAEQKLSEQLNQTSTQLKDANDAITQKQSALDRAISSGRVRLPASSCVQTSSGPTSPPGGSNEASSESDRETLRLIAQIAADGDKAVNQLNACIDAYNQVKDQVNGQR